MKKKSFIQKNGLIAVWSMAGLIACGYIAFLVLVTGQQNMSAQKYASANVAPIADRGAEQAQADVTNLRAHVDELKQQEERLAAKLSKIEEMLGPITASISGPKPSGYGIDEEPVAHDAAQPATPSAILVKMSPLPQDDSVAEVYSRSGFDAYGLKLATARSVDALERHWDYLQKTSTAPLANLKPRYLSKGSAEQPLFELIAGPLDRMSDATARCQQLGKVNVDCEHTRYDLIPAAPILNAAQNSKP